MAGQGSDPLPSLVLTFCCCLQVCCALQAVSVESQTSDQQTARLHHLLDTGTAMLWSIQYNRRGTAQARHLHVTVSQGLGGPTAQVACMAPHICIIHSSQRQTNSFSFCDLTNNSILLTSSELLGQH
jgi:hypothetical protein